MTDEKKIKLLQKELSKFLEGYKKVDKNNE
jgi:hypothetical protein